MTSVLLAIPVLVVGAMVLAALRSNRVAAAVAIAVQTVATVLVLIGVAGPLFGGVASHRSVLWPEPFARLDFSVDGLSAFFLAWSLPLTLAGTIYAVGYLRPYFHKGRHAGPHYALLNLISTSFVIVYTSQNALVFLLGWEIAAVAAWLLVIWDYRNQKIRFAGFNYLVSTHVGLFVLVAAFMTLHSKSGAFDFESFRPHLRLGAPARGTVFLLLCTSFALKSAFFPFHTWLPRAHSAAPAHVSALMSGVIHKAGLFAFLRFSLLLGTPEEWMGWTVLAFGAGSAVFGVLFTTTQRDLKRLLGYSSTENVGIIAMGFGVGYLGWTWNLPALAWCGFAGAVLHILNHALFKCLLFYGAGSIYHAKHTVDLERLGGLAKGMPRTAALFLVGALAISALPPLNGFASELLIYSGLLSSDAPVGFGGIALAGAAGVLAFVGAVSAFAMTRAFGVAFLGHAREPTASPPQDPPSTMLSVMFVHACGALLLGVFPSVGLSLVRSTIALFPFPSPPPASLLPLHVATWGSRGLAAAILLVGVVRVLQTRRARRSEVWGCGYTHGSTRMQYTGAGFSEQFARIFVGAMPPEKRQQLPEETFPQKAGEAQVHHPDPVERRMFEVLGQGEQLLEELAHRIKEEPRLAFAAGALTLLVLGAVVLGGVHP